MKRISKTSDPVGTVLGTITGGAVLATAAALGCPPLGIPLAIFQFFLAKKISKRAAERELDEISLNDCERVAQTWARNRKPGEHGATVTVTKWTDAMIPLPQTRIHHFISEEGDLSVCNRTLGSFNFDPSQLLESSNPYLDKNRNFKFPFKLDDD